MQRKQSGPEEAMRSLTKSMSRWRHATEQLHRLSRLQMEALMVGNMREFGLVLWQKQTAQRDFLKAAAQAKSARSNSETRNWASEPSKDLTPTVSELKRMEEEIAELVMETAGFESRTDQILRLKMRHPHAA